MELVIDEPIDGHFYWTIVQPRAEGLAPTVVDYAKGALPSRQAATEHGLAAMRRWKKTGPVMPAASDAIAPGSMLPDTVPGFLWP